MFASLKSCKRLQEQKSKNKPCEDDCNILFIVRTMGIGGTENVVLQLCETLSGYVNKIVVCSTGGAHENELKEMGIKHYKIPDVAGKKLSDVLKTILVLKKIIKTEKITIIHSHHRMAAFYAELVAGKGIAKIATAHNTFQNKKILTRFAYHNTQLVAVGEMVKKNLVSYYNIPVRQVEVIHNAVKPFYGNIVEDSLIKQLHDEGCFVVGNIGRLSEQKGMEYFIKALPDVIEKHHEVRFIIAGSGEDEEKLKNLSEEINVTDYIHFLGYRTDVQNLMRQLDLIVLSSLWEGLPLTPIEAFSVGRTIIATAVDGTVEIVKDGVDGWLINPKDSAQIADKICALVEKPETKENMEAQAFKKYQSEFTFDELKKRYIKYYEEIINDN